MCSDVSETIVRGIKELDQERIEGMCDEVKSLIQKFDNLSDAEKGHAIGYCIGRYGIDIFAGSAAIKCVSIAKKLKDANRLCNLEAMASSAANKEMLKAAAINHAMQREAYFKNVVVHVDKQNKHVPGKHNYIEGRSIFTHPDPQNLLEKFAGKGTPKANRIPGNPNYRERVDFGEFIGYHVDQVTGIKTSTSYGEIHYSKTGAHIVPVLPP